MRNLLITIGVVLAVVAGGGSAQAADKIRLNILYAGKPGSERERDFVAFLKEHFTGVTSSDMSKFAPAQAAGVDVVLLDWDGSVDDLFKSPRPNLDGTYSRATVTLGIPGAFICAQRGLKTGYT